MICAEEIFCFPAEVFEFVVNGLELPVGTSRPLLPAPYLDTRLINANVLGGYRKSSSGVWSHSQSGA